MLYFAYGANLNKAGMLRRCPGSKALSKAVLHGYKLVFKGCADIVPSANDSVPGALWEITEACRKSLDRFEGYPSFYIRKQVSVVRGDTGETVEAMIYQMTGRRVLSPPYPSYLFSIITGRRNWSLGVKDLMGTRCAG